MQNRYKDWLSSAENDLLWGKDSCKNGYYAQSCYVSQQVAEKALKAYAYFQGYSQAKSHSVAQIAQELSINGIIEKNGKKLDLYYIPARYPDAFPAGAPHELFSKEQAEEALLLADEILQIIKSNIEKQVHEK